MAYIPTYVPARFIGLWDVQELASRVPASFELAGQRKGFRRYTTPDLQTQLGERAKALQAREEALATILQVGSSLPPNLCCAKQQSCDLRCARFYDTRPSSCSICASKPPLMGLGLCHSRHRLPMPETWQSRLVCVCIVVHCRRRFVDFIKP